MRRSIIHIAVAAIFGALSPPAFASGEGFDPKRECSVCDDPTWPELRDAMPAIVVPATADTRTAILESDPTWPEIREPAPAIVLRPDNAGDLAAVQSDTTWPTTSSFAPALRIHRRQPEGRVVQR
jgi:hypothetical protein